MRAICRRLLCWLNCRGSRYQARLRAVPSLSSLCLFYSLQLRVRYFTCFPTRSSAQKPRFLRVFSRAVLCSAAILTRYVVILSRPLLHVSQSLLHSSSLCVYTILTVVTQFVARRLYYINCCCTVRRSTYINCCYTVRRSK
uniref:Uncharacterized protein n=1 Tax=Schizaphis graminum TaxID=13262 RepID=A0A2S2NMR6_SCHGA